MVIHNVYDTEVNESIQLRQFNGELTVPPLPILRKFMKENIHIIFYSMLLRAAFILFGCGLYAYFS